MTNRPSGFAPVWPEAGAGVGGDVWNDGLTRRLRSLLRTAPLHQLRSSRAAALLPHDDPGALCMKALEVLVDALGLRPGASRAEVENALVPLMEANDLANAVEPSRDRHLGVVQVVIGALLNDAERRQAYSAEYLDFEDGHPVTKRLTFRLVSEQEALDGSIVLRVEPDGINLFLKSLDVPLEDAHAATEAVIQSQLARGRLDLALHSAREAQIRSIQYQDHVQAVLKRTQRDLGRVDWRHEVPRLLDEALRHVHDRVGIERQLLDTIEERIQELLGTDQAHALVRIRDMLEDCRRRHLDLQRLLMGARTVFLDEQARQRFAPVPIRAVVALEAEVLGPMLQLPIRDAELCGGVFATSVEPATPPAFFDLRQLWDRLLQPPRRVNLAGPEIDLELHELEEPPPVFEEALAARVDAMLVGLGQPTRLSDVLTRLSDPAEAHYAVLRSLQHYAPEQRRTLPISVERTPGPLNDTRFSGDELMISSEVPDAD